MPKKWMFGDIVQEYERAQNKEIIIKRISKLANITEEGIIKILKSTFSAEKHRSLQKNIR